MRDAKTFVSCYTITKRMSGSRLIFAGARAIALCALLFYSAAAFSQDQSGLDPRLFPIPDQLKANIAFWTDVYSVYTSDQAVLHDERHLGVVYEVIELADLDQPGVSEGRLRKLRRRRIDETRDKIVAVLKKLARAAPQNGEEELIHRFFKDTPGGREKFSVASRRVRAQTGLRDRFAEAVVIAGRYIPEIERIFTREGLPPVLSRLPFVESMFVSVAHSKVGAVGAWQFMPATARIYLQMNSAVDSRVDTLLAAKGAARMLRQDHESLGTWPLALTAYNHGRGGMSRAVRQVGTRDIGVISEKYRANRFGFASRNFYSEFVAASRVYARRSEHFPKAVADPELRFDALVLPRFVSLVDLASRAGTSISALEGLNPALNSDVFSGTLLVPRSYPLRLPKGELASFQKAYEAIPANRKLSSQLQVGYKVRSGDTLGKIAHRFGSMVGALQRANGLSRPNRIYAGQYLRIPGQSFGSFAASEPAAVDSAVRVTEAPSHHVVKRGETLSSIARRYGHPVGDLVAANALASANEIVVGQRLRIAPSGASSISLDAGPTRHTVRRGESLTRIARSYGTDVAALKSKNGLESTVIHPGQVLLLP